MGSYSWEQSSEFESQVNFFNDLLQKFVLFFLKAKNKWLWGSGWSTCKKWLPKRTKSKLEGSKTFLKIMKRYSYTLLLYLILIKLKNLFYQYSNANLALPTWHNLDRAAVVSPNVLYSERLVRLLLLLRQAMPSFGTWNFHFSFLKIVIFSLISLTGLIRN